MSINRWGGIVMGYITTKEMSEYKKCLSSNIKDTDTLLRLKYTNALLILLRYLYDTGIIYEYEKFVERQKNSIKDPIALNGNYYENDDILALKSKGITDKDKQINELMYLPKYADIVDWSNIEPNLTYMDGDTMGEEFRGEKYKFIIDQRKTKFKRIHNKLYDKVIVSIYQYNNDIEDYQKVATGSFYYYSGSKYQYRYMNLYDTDGTLLPDIDNRSEYSQDNSSKTR